MAKEASIEAWRTLYEIAAKIKEKKPWENFCDLDLIGIQEEKKEKTVFFSILGHGGSCYGISVYEGYKGFNDFLLLAQAEELNVSAEYAMFHQHALSCCWGNREDLSEKQRKLLKELGLKYRGKNQWLYFLSYQDGYFPYMLDEEEVSRMTRYLSLLSDALDYWEKENLCVDFEKDMMYLYAFNQKEKTWEGKEQELPFTSLQIARLELNDPQFEAELKQARRGNYILEADISFLGSAVKDKKYSRPANPKLCLIAEAKSGMIIRADMAEPDESAEEKLAGHIIDFILGQGAPKEIRISNHLLSFVLGHICSLAGIQLKQVSTLPALSRFFNDFTRFS